MRPLVSICVNNFNYAAFLTQAIDSALAQTYAPIEVIVVDDGSTDGSREIIAGYGDRIVPVLKSNGGQASAVNAGVARSTGAIICFLDSDDTFAPEKVARVVDAFARRDPRSRPTMVHHLLTIVGEGGGASVGRTIGRKHHSPLNLYDFAQRYGFMFYMAGPTSSLVLDRALADLLFPIPEEGIRTSADDFIVLGAALIGDLYSIDASLGCYRVHGENAWFAGNRQKPEPFRRSLDRYLNDKLAASGLRPVMWSEQSTKAWSELAGDERWRPLLAEMLAMAASERAASDHNAPAERHRRAALRLAIKGLSEAAEVDTNPDSSM